jgi:hypothetical protein
VEEGEGEMSDPDFEFHVPGLAIILGVLIVGLLGWLSCSTLDYGRAEECQKACAPRMMKEVTRGRCACEEKP